MNSTADGAITFMVTVCAASEPARYVIVTLPGEDGAVHVKVLPACSRRCPRPLADARHCPLLLARNVTRSPTATVVRSSGAYSTGASSAECVIVVVARLVAGGAAGALPAAEDAVGGAPGCPSPSPRPVWVLAILDSSGASLPSLALRRMGIRAARAGAVGRDGVDNAR